MVNFYSYEKNKFETFVSSMLKNNYPFENTLIFSLKQQKAARLSHGCLL